MTRGTIRVAAPGKLFLSGEYAVLAGAPAVVTSVDRLAVAEPAIGPVPPSPVLRAVGRRVEDFLRERGASAAVTSPVRVHSDRFSVDGNKLGIGSSAAVAVCATGFHLENVGFPVSDNRDLIVSLATGAHMDSQGGRGSGADVAISTMGGTIVFRRGDEPAPIDSPPLVVVPVWTGRAASTVDLVAAVNGLADRDSELHSEKMGRLEDLANSLADEFTMTEPAAVLHLLEEYGEAMGALGLAAGVSILTPAHEAVRTIARECGGAAKPSGAGGGDVAVAMFESADDADRFASRCFSGGLTVVDLSIHTDGVSSRCY